MGLCVGGLPRASPHSHQSVRLPRAARFMKGGGRDLPAAFSQTHLSAGYPVRKSIQQDVLGTRFPQLSAGGLREPVAGVPQGRRRPRRKVLPDRSRAARDRANQKLVEYIVKARGAERHLQAILKNRKPSRWLKMFLNSGQYVTCVETYLEDEEQLDLVVQYLQRVYQEAGSRAPVGVSSDRIRFILDVLLPEVSGLQQRPLCELGGLWCGGPAIPSLPLVTGTRVFSPRENVTD